MLPTLLKKKKEAQSQEALATRSFVLILLVFCLAMIGASLYLTSSVSLTSSLSSFGYYFAGSGSLETFPEYPSGDSCSSLATLDQCLESDSCTPLMTTKCDLSGRSFLGCYAAKQNQSQDMTTIATQQCASDGNIVTTWLSPEKVLLRSPFVHVSCSLCQDLRPKLALLTLYWNEKDSAQHSLKTWYEQGLMDLVHEKIVFIQEMNQEKIDLYSPYNFTILGSQANENIALGLDALVKKATSDYVLFLEKDWAIFEKPEKVVAEIQKGLDLLINHGFHLHRYRSRRNPGVPSQAVTFKDKADHLASRYTGMLCGFYHIEENPDVRWAGKMVKVETHEGFFSTQSTYCAWSNNPFMIARSFWLTNLSQYAARMDKSDKYGWERFMHGTFGWGAKNYKIGLGDGLFTHHEINED